MFIDQVSRESSRNSTRKLLKKTTFWTISAQLWPTWEPKTTKKSAFWGTYSTYLQM